MLNVLSAAKPLKNKSFFKLCLCRFSIIQAIVIFINWNVFLVF